MVLYYECPWDLQLKILNNVSIMLLNKREAVIFPFTERRENCLNSKSSRQNRWLDGGKCRLMEKTSTQCHLGYLVWFGVCQIENSDGAFSRQIKGVLSRKMCPPIASLNSRCVCAECQVIRETAAPYWHHCRIRIPERGTMEEKAGEGFMIDAAHFLHSWNIKFLLEDPVWLLRNSGKEAAVRLVLQEL